MLVHCRALVLLLISVGWLGLTSSAYDFDSSHYPAQDVITRDFCIIGGGSSGTYAAIRLHDKGKSIVVVERKDRLGGHTETYIDPATQIPTDIGVMEWNNLDVARTYLDRLNVSYTTTNNSVTSTAADYVNFRSGELLSTYVPPDPTAALAAYAAQLSKYPYLSLGFNLSSPIPEDLLLPFGDFVTKYSLQDVVHLLFIYAQGIGDLLRQPTLYVMKLNGLDLLQSFQIGFLFTTSRDNSEVYEKAQSILAADVLLCSHVVAMDCQSKDGYAKVVVKTGDGVTKLIQAKTIIVSIPPKLDNLVGFDLTAQETALFAQFENQWYYTALLRDTGLPGNKSLINTDANNLYGLPTLPAAYAFYPSAVVGLTSVLYGSAYQRPDEKVKANIIATLQRLPEMANVSTSPSFAVFSGHVPFELTVSTSAIAGGFYGELYGLQGQSRTYHTGAAFHTHDSAMLWRFTEGLLPTIIGE